MKKDFRKLNKDKLASELRRAHLMILLLALGVGLLTIINSTGTASMFSNVLSYILVILCALIALTSLVVFVNLSLKKK